MALLLDGPGRPPQGASPELTLRIQKLFELSKSGTRFGLERIGATLAALGHPERAHRMVHVAGSNGKGSTCAFLAAILSQRGRRVGLYTSPHLVRVTERIQVVKNAVPEEISDTDFVAALDAVESVAPGFADLSFFEVLTAAGLWALARQPLDYCVIEAGLGARLDATRLVDAQVAVLTDLSLEHTNILGDTIEAITREEAAVMRPHRPLVAADGPTGAMLELQRMVREAEVPLWRIGERLAVTVNPEGTFDLDLCDFILDDVQVSLLGPWQGRNALLAAMAARLMDPTLNEYEIRSGLARAVWPGRMEVIRRPGRPPVLLDGAHNPQGAEALSDALRFSYKLFHGPKHLVFGVVSDKNFAPMVHFLAPHAATVCVTRPDSERARDPAEVAALFPAECRAETFADWRDAWARAEALAEADGGWIVACGSLYLLGAIRGRLLGSA